ncbi:hypothetical protein K438DRAFT_2024723 [Mycena galopus ATCC 62051]|nr:hypothetical protein K438DRAFT_2024723 [Mycena galopus ATCC 62051]
MSPFELRSALVAMDPIAAQSDLQLNSYINVASLTLLTYDTMLNFSLEYRYIWKSKWGLIKCLYLWARYGTFLEISLDVLRRVDARVNLDPSTCTTLSKFITIYSGFSMGITEVILMVRTYALCGRSKTLLGFFIALWLSIGAFCTWALLNYTGSIQVEPSSYSISCDLYSSNNILLLCYVALLAGETVIVLLTLWQALRTYRQAGLAFKSHRLILSFYRDGVMFYLVMLLCLIFVVVLQSDAPVALKPIGDTPLRVIHSILACHLVVHVRVIAAKDETNSAVTLPPIVFAKSPAESGRGIDSIV